jgi:hypothetical protein
MVLRVKMAQLVLQAKTEQPVLVEPEVKLDIQAIKVKRVLLVFVVKQGLEEKKVLKVRLDQLVLKV